MESQFLVAQFEHSLLGAGRAQRKASAGMLLVLLIFISVAGRVNGQVGNQNPSGPSGIFNGQITTGCSYDPYTGNAMRSVTDINVAGTVGEYPLALVRTANSRTPSTSEVFGYGGGWNHNYNWTMDDSGVGYSQNFSPTQYTVNFPDGRVETFKSVTWDPGYFRVRTGTNGSAGVRERIAPIAPPGNMDAYVILSDGGKVKFRATLHNFNGQYHYSYKATAIIDPYGLQTALTWETVNGRNRLTRIQEPAGRYLQITYSGSGPRISQIQEFINNVGKRTVQYYYSYTMLDHVAYYANPNWVARYQYTGANTDPNLPPLLWTCDDPMYPGPMKRIAYTYKPGMPNDPSNPDGTRPVYGQIFQERYWDGIAGDETSGQIVSELTVGTANPANPNVRIEKCADNMNQTRRFIYTSAGYLTWAYDFMNHAASQSYDAYHWINSVTDRNGNATDYTCDPITGNVTQIKFPLTPGDTPGQGNTRPTINYSYTNNYFLHAILGENNQTTTIVRDGSNRVTEIDYPDGGYETFPSYNNFNQVLTHRMRTSGTESFTYDGRGLRQTYRNPDNASGNPTARYQYDDYDRVSDVTDALGTSLGDANHTTRFSYNLRGQLTVTTLPNDNGSRHTVKSYYNDDGTVRSQENELYQSTQYTYDEYRRLKTVTPPTRGWGDNGTYATSFYYGANANDNVTDYKYTDSNVTWVVLPSGKTSNIAYDYNRRRTSVTVGSGSEAAVTGYGYDNVGNLTSVSNPLGHDNVSTSYDERDRPYSVTVGGQPTTLTYDTAGRRKTVTRPNQQVITNVNFDAMNRVKLQTVSRANNSNMVTQYVYYTPADGTNAPVGLLKTFEDPKIYNSGEVHTYEWDSMGRKKKLTYPKPVVNAQQKYEQWTYDTAGRLCQFRNRAAKTQTFAYDALNRMTGFNWNDGLTPSVSFGYDVASRLTDINNVNANITRAYYNDGLLRSETEQILLTGGRSKAVTYTYNDDGNRASIQYPDNYTFGYSYTSRNKLEAVTGWASYIYDTRGNLTARTLTANGTTSDYLYDTHDRMTRVRNFLSGTTRTVTYGYDDLSNNRLWSKRVSGPRSPESGKGEVFGYDLADQATGVQLNVANPDQVQQPINPNIIYDSNGNRTWFQPSGWNESYVVNNLNQYSSRTKYIGGINATTATYDSNGNLLLGLDTPSISSYQFDAQNRLLSANKGNTTMYFEYDGLNRQVSRRIGANGTRTFNVWDGWDLVEEYQSAGGGATTAAYAYGTGGLIAATINGQLVYFYQDASDSTSYLANASGQLLEWYRYDLQGAPFFYNANDTQLSTTNYSVRHLFTGQQWYQDIGLYDLRNRFYSPDIGRFLQPDPIGFWGDRTNLYRNCRNNPVTRKDPSGLQDAVNRRLEGNDIPEADPIVVPGENVPYDNPTDHPSFNPMPGFGPLGGPGGGDAGRWLNGSTFEYHLSPRNSNVNTQRQPPSQNPPTQVTATTLAAPPAALAPPAGVFSLWQPMLITAFSDPIGDHDNVLGRGDIATADLRYQPSDFDAQNHVIHVYTGRPTRAYHQGSLVTIYRHDGSIYTGRITDTGAGFAAHRPRLGLPDGVPGTLWLDIWTLRGREDPEWDLVLIQSP